jgi:hypothetical protein
MAAKIFSNLREITFSGMEFPITQRRITLNILRASIWGTMGSGGTALVSFIFSRYLIQNEPWKSIAPYVVKATLWSCGTFAAVAAYLIYKNYKCINTSSHNNDFLFLENYLQTFHKTLNDGLSRFAKSYAMIGLIGAAAAALATKHVQESSLGLSAAGSILWLFTNQQNQPLTDTQIVAWRVESIKKDPAL